MRTGEWGRLGWDAVASGFMQETAARAAAGRVRVSVPLHQSAGPAADCV